MTALVGVQDGWFIGKLAALNALVIYGRSKGLKALQPIWDLTDRKHRETKPHANKREYQAAYMAERRKRQNRAVALWEKHHGKMAPEEKRAFRKTIQAVWMVERDAIIESNDTLDWADKHELIREFWERVDALLTAGLKGDKAAADEVLGDVG